jgi:hypothetical protein
MRFLARRPRGKSGAIRVSKSSRLTVSCGNLTFATAETDAAGIACESRGPAARRPRQGAARIDRESVDGGQTERRCALVPRSPGLSGAEPAHASAGGSPRCPSRLSALHEMFASHVQRRGGIERGAAGKIGARPALLSRPLRGFLGVRVVQRGWKMLAFRQPRGAVLASVHVHRKRRSRGGLGTLDSFIFSSRRCPPGGHSAGTFTPGGSPGHLRLLARPRRQAPKPETDRRAPGRFPRCREEGA